MYQTIELATQRRVLVNGAGSEIPLDVVMGISGEQFGEVRTAYDKRLPFPNLDEQEQIELTITDAAAARLVEFYRRSFVEHEELDYNCRGFLLYVLGVQVEPTHIESFNDEFDFGPPVPPDALENGGAYGVLGSDKVSAHAMMGVSSPAHSLSAFGSSGLEGGGALIYAANRDLMRIYEGQRIGAVMLNGGHIMDRPVGA